MKRAEALSAQKHIDTVYQSSQPVVTWLRVEWFILIRSGKDITAKLLSQVLEYLLCKIHNITPASFWGRQRQEVISAIHLLQSLHTPFASSTVIKFIGFCDYQLLAL
jgi:hypothetical protein